MAKQLKQHQQSAITERSERKGTSALSPEQRTNDRSVKVTGTDITHESTAKNAEERRKENHAVNGHEAGVSVGLAAASKSGNRNAEGVKSTDLGWGG
jgi:hypothetical protein